MAELIPGRDEFSSQQSIAACSSLSRGCTLQNPLLPHWLVPGYCRCLSLAHAAFQGESDSPQTAGFSGSQDLSAPTSEMLLEIQMQEPVVWMYLSGLDSPQSVDLCVCPVVVSRVCSCVFPCVQLWFPVYAVVVSRAVSVCCEERLLWWVWELHIQQRWLCTKNNIYCFLFYAWVFLPIFTSVLHVCALPSEARRL